MFGFLGRLAQLVQSAALTRRRSLVRSQQRPHALIPIEKIGILKTAATHRNRSWAVLGQGGGRRFPARRDESYGAGGDPYSVHRRM